MSRTEGLWLLVFVVATFGAAALGSAFTSTSVNTWYAQLHKPAFNPPNWVFGPVWSTLYLLMAVSAWLVWRNGGWTGGSVALTLFIIQLALNVLWSALFFGLRQPGFAMIDIVLLLSAIIGTTVAFMPVSKLAFWLMGPYVLWVSFASVLNFKIWQLNR